MLNYFLGSLVLTHGTEVYSNQITVSWHLIIYNHKWLCVIKGNYIYTSITVTDIVTDTKSYKYRHIHITDADAITFTLAIT